jgi:hypothetical protein
MTDKTNPPIREEYDEAIQADGAVRGPRKR